MAVALALAGSVALGGCTGTTTADTAAVVDGRVITVTETREATQQINETFDPQSPFTEAQALSLLIRAPYIIEYAAAAGNAVSESVATNAVPDLTEPAASTIEILRAEAATQTLDDPAKIALTQQFRDLDVTVNPRYGTFNAQEAIVRATPPNWIVTTPGG